MFRVALRSSSSGSRSNASLALTKTRSPLRSHLPHSSFALPTSSSSLHRSSPSFASSFRSTNRWMHASRPSQNGVLNSSFLSGSSATYIDSMYFAWRQDPKSVHPSWQAYFSTGDFSSPPGAGQAASTAAGGLTLAQSSDLSSLTSRVVLMVRAFQVRGHLLANIDPLGFLPPRPENEDLQLDRYGFTQHDLNKEIDLAPLSADLKGFLDRREGGKLTLGHLYNRLKDVYCGNIGYEYMHIPSVEKCNWIRERIETREKVVYSKAEKVQILDRLTWADHFETFLASKFSTAKRFGLEGAESCIPAMKAMIQRSVELGVQNVVIGMPHRGRLNVLNTVLRKPQEQIFREFGVGETGQHDPHAGPGDVKYHLGMSRDAPIGPDRRIVHLTLVPNPSHLETVNPVVLGKTRAKQFFDKDEPCEKSMALLLHGDAAFAGQGVVYESMGMQSLPGFSTGGTVHIVVNNQVGFTTDPTPSGRSTPYCTDISKTFNVPIFHVNGDDPESVVFVSQLAAEYRAKFHTDVVIDLVCYRRHGHNEVDEPMFTQPVMYDKIKKHPSTLTLYQQRLLKEGVEKDVIDKVSSSVQSTLNTAYEASKHWDHKTKELFRNWAGMKMPTDYSEPQKTGVDVELLRSLGIKASSYPANFTPHSRLQGILATRLKTLNEGKDLDWATAETLAFGSLLADGLHIRLTGQDVERGTFSHRHAVIHDVKTNQTYTPLAHISPTQPAFSIFNSHLSEYGVLGFELGYSLEDPHALVLWEAQFGDFFNTAQVIVDQFISSMEDKWGKQSGLVLLLPHGYEGQGPEHSSARLERFLQQTNDHPDHLPERDKTRAIQLANWQVANVTTPANYFHILRRQVKREFRKPLILVTPKSLLRSSLARSTLAEMGPDTMFQRVIGDHDALMDPAKVNRIILCSGKVYYDLLQRRVDKGIHDVAMIRVEQLAPFPFYEVADEILKFNPNAEIVWVQEEPMNMGAWTYVQPRIQTALRQARGDRVQVKFIGRPPMGSTAAGKDYVHKKEQERLILEALNLPLPDTNKH